MPIDRDAQTERSLSNREAWITYVGMILGFSGPLIVILSHYDLMKLGTTCLLVGISLFLLPLNLRWRLWPFVALFLALGILGIVLAPSEVGILCLFAATVLLLWLSWLWSWRVKWARRR